MSHEHHRPVRARKLCEPFGGKVRTAARLPQRLRPHDFRRTAARDYQGFMTEQEIMDLCSWKTRSTFERYNIVRPEDVDAGLARRFNGKVAAKSETPEREPEHVS